MCALTAHIGNRQDEVGRQLFLNVQIPLLHVRPLNLIRNGNDLVQGKDWNWAASGTNISITDDIGLRSCQHERWRTFERFAVSFVAVGMLVKDAVAAANGHFAVALGVKRKTDTGRGVEEMTR